MEARQNWHSCAQTHPEVQHQPLCAYPGAFPASKVTDTRQLEQTRLDVQEYKTPSLELLASIEDELLKSTNCTKSGSVVHLRIEQETFSITQETANPNTDSAGAERCRLRGETWQESVTSHARNLPSCPNPCRKEIGSTGMEGKVKEGLQNI